MVYSTYHTMIYHFDQFDKFLQGSPPPTLQLGSEDQHQRTVERDRFRKTLCPDKMGRNAPKAGKLGKGSLEPTKTKYSCFFVFLIFLDHCILINNSFMHGLRVGLGGSLPVETCWIGGAKAVSGQ